MKKAIRSLTIGLLLILLGFGTATAQNEVDYGINAGVGFGQFTGRQTMNTSNQTLFRGGFFTELNFSDVAAFQGELNLVRYGTGGTYRMFTRTYTKASLVDLQLPLLGKLKWPVSQNLQPNLFAGPAFNYNIYKNLVRKNDSRTSYPQPDIHKVNVGFVGGAGIDFGTINLEVRYEKSLTNTFQVSNIKNNQLFLSVGYEF